jgi:hypothetical protein
MEGRPILGLVGAVFLKTEDEDTKLAARIDSGATASSIDASLVKKHNLGPVIRSKIVKSAAGVKERPIIKATVKIEGQIIESEFTVADRSHMTYPILIGQDVLKKGKFLIDPLLEERQ